MAVDMFLKIDGINGEAQDDKHADEIDVLAWSWGMSQSGTTHMGGGGGSGKVSIQDLSVTKYVDKATPVLMKYCSDGNHIKKAKLTIRKAGGKQVEYIVLNMEDIIVTSISSGGSGGEDRLTENITLNFSVVKYDYSPQKADGSLEAAVKYGRDIAANKDL
ncbi:type VI secretion system tube protein Hcp [Vibrio albus]|uniref:Type VI secretion system tube protein Hcp n=1 Tax=Vibrio albus TaxID=2200953 RepID=A0A2U3BBD5_9VIBR|nr:type VI secretion system tube protein Hcp [Vibrio albus]PWI34101.1 type VI secretion system tube protein Hcp [Vibrio albus]